MPVASHGPLPSLIYKIKGPGRPPTSSSDSPINPSEQSKARERQQSYPNQNPRREPELAASTKLEEEPLGRLGADPPPPPETEEQRNKFLVLRLYEALHGRDHAAVQALLAPDLEWWFHGPPKHQHHMMRVLTGGGGGSTNSNYDFSFVPRSVDAFGSTVIAEGPRAPLAAGVYWVHAWTVGPDGVITQLREYFNTDLTVTRLAAAAAASKCIWIWQSRRPDRATNSLPGLVLAL